MAWTPEFIELFNELKKEVTSSQDLVRFDPRKLTFCETDWNAEVMRWIRMHPTDDKESQRAVKL